MATMFECSDINIDPAKYRDKDKCNFATMDEYLKIARTTISKYGGPFSQKMLKNDDIVSNIATKIMLGDWMWDESKSTQSSYRIQRARWAIQSYLTRMHQGKKGYAIIHNETVLGSVPHNEDRYTLDDHEELEYVFATPGLTARESEFIKLHYLDEMTAREIAEQHQVSKQRVAQVIKRGLERIQQRHKNANT